MPDDPTGPRGAPAVPVVTVRLTAAFHALTGGRKQLLVEGGSIREVLAGLGRISPRALERILGPEGSVKRYVNVYRNDDDIRRLEGMETAVEDEDVIWIIPAVAGGDDRARNRG